MTLNPIGDNDQIKGRLGCSMWAGYGSKKELESVSHLPKLYEDTEDYPWLGLFRLFKCGNSLLISESCEH